MRPHCYPARAPDGCRFVAQSTRFLRPLTTALRLSFEGWPWRAFEGWSWRASATGISSAVLCVAIDERMGTTFLDAMRHDVHASLAPA